MKNYKITYFMYPDKDIEINIKAKDENEAMAFAKAHRNDPYKVEEIEEENKMKWFLEEITNTDGFTTRLDASTREEAEKEARDIFERLDKRDQDRRIGVYVVYAEEDENGCPDIENIEDEIVIK